MTFSRFASLSTLSLIIIVLSIFLIGLDRTGWLPLLRPITTTIYSWVILLAAFSLFIGVLNVVWVHLSRIQAGQSGWALSLTLIATLLGVVVAGLVDIRGAASPVVEWIFAYVIAPIEATLFALLVFFLIAAAYRFLRLDRTGVLWILSGVLITLLVQTPVSHAWLPPLVLDATNWLLEYPVMAALRGAILGSSLALAIVGIRFLIGTAWRNRD